MISPVSAARGRAHATYDPLMIYGASGFTGRLITRRLTRLGVRPLLCGRSRPKLAAVAEPLGLEYRIANLADEHALDRALGDVDVVLHAAGPFSATSRPMVDACLRTRTHYVDISGEIPVIEDLARRDTEARARKTMIMPGAGFDVVPSDCLAAHVARRLPWATKLSLGLTGLAFATRGSAKTLVEHAGYVAIRRNGVITRVVPGARERAFDYGAGLRRSLNVSWGDVAAAYYSTGIPNIEVYFESTTALRSMLTASRYFAPWLRADPSQAWLKAWAELLPEGPGESERDAKTMVIVADAEDGDRHAIARLRTPEAYTFTAMTAPAIAQRVLAGDIEPGFQTPARVYGPDFVLGFAGVVREDVQ
jgi:short subunit dehydrogenase-like uncharacterized protein